MTQLFRWQYSVPRILAVIVALLAVQFVLGLVARRRAERTLESCFSTEACLANARVSFVDGRVTLHGLRVAAPRGNVCPLFDAQCCDLDFDLDALVRHQLWSGSGHISGLRFFASPQITSDLSASSFAESTKDSVGHRDSEAGPAALAELTRRLNHDWTDELPSQVLTNQVTMAWSRKQQALCEQVKDLQRRSADIRSLAEAAQRNPLRNQGFFDTLPGDLAALREQSDVLTQEINHAPEALDKGRRIIVASRQQDEQFLRERLVSPEIAGSQLSAYLHATHVNQLMPEIIAWLKWSREAFPVAGNKSADVRLPNVHLRTVTLAGDVHLSGSAYPVTGELTDFTSAPTSASEPIRLRLTAKDGTQFDALLTIDRRGDTPRDELLVTWKADVPEEQSLGQPGDLELSLRHTATAYTVSLRLEGDEITGELQAVQTGVQIEGKLVTSRDTQQHLTLNETLSGMNSVATRLSISGTLDNPRCELWSNLGPATSAALRIASQRAAEQRAQELIAIAQKRVDERLAQLDRLIADSQSNLLAQLTGSQAAWQKLAAESTQPSRLQSERLGRLPAQSLFR
jgi:uncharacterized protein (TIGR03545 family)